MRALALAPSGLLARQGRPVHTAHGSSLRRAQVVSSAPRSGPDAFRKRAWRWLSSRGPNSGDWLRVGPGPPRELGRARPPPWEHRGCAWGAPGASLPRSCGLDTQSLPRQAAAGGGGALLHRGLRPALRRVLHDPPRPVRPPPPPSRVPARRPFFHTQSSWSCNLWNCGNTKMMADSTPPPYVRRRPDRTR